MSGAPSKAQVRADLECLSFDCRRIAADIVNLRPGATEPMLVGSLLSLFADVAFEAAKMVGELP